jgi:hypothetical protein
VPLDLALYVDFVDFQSFVDPEGIGGLAVEQIGRKIEGVREAVRGIDAHHEGSVSHLGKPNSCCGGHAALADAPFTAEK